MMGGQKLGCLSFFYSCKNRGGGALVSGEGGGQGETWHPWSVFFFLQPVWLGAGLVLGQENSELLPTGEKAAGIAEKASLERPPLPLKVCCRVSWQSAAPPTRGLDHAVTITCLTSRVHFGLWSRRTIFFSFLFCKASTRERSSGLKLNPTVRMYGYVIPYTTRRQDNQRFLACMVHLSFTFYAFTLNLSKQQYPTNQ